MDVKAHHFLKFWQTPTVLGFTGFLEGLLLSQTTLYQKA